AVEAGSDNERLGVARDSMLRNPRILKAELGKPQRNCYTLPGFDFAYGLYIERTDGGVPEAIGHWNTIKPRTGLTRNMPRDFITMNRGALKAGYTTAREFNLYYKAKDIRRKDDEYSRFRRSPPKVPADMTYGMPARPSTPFFDVFQHKYKELWMEQQRALTAALRVEKKKVIILQQYTQELSKLRAVVLWSKPSKRLRHLSHRDTVLAIIKHPSASICPWSQGAQLNSCYQLKWRL
uniref:Cilia and flagella associated protein 77 n=1 Tax=Anas zonorhyncha TaxID=75864 RepID=A0A8B9UJ43_9AVES